MKLHADQSNTSTVQGHGPGWIAVNGQRISHSVVLSSTAEPTAWSCQRFEDLLPEHFEQLVALQPELVIFGSGQKLRFPHPATHAALMAKRIGLETMDTLAACRTYNILAQEGRRVVAVLLIEAAQAA